MWSRQDLESDGQNRLASHKEWLRRAERISVHFVFHRRTVSTLLVSLGGFLEVSFWSSFATLNCPACWSSDLPKMCLNHKVMRERGGNLCALYCIVLFQPLWSSWFGQNFWKTGRVLSLGDAESCYKFISSKNFETLWQAGSKVDQKRAKKGILKNCQTSPEGVHA